MPLTPRQLDRACMVAILVLSGMIAIGGGVPMIDHTTHRVLAREELHGAGPRKPASRWCHTQ